MAANNAIDLAITVHYSPVCLPQVSKHLGWLEQVRQTVDDCLAGQWLPASLHSRRSPDQTAALLLCRVVLHRIVRFDSRIELLNDGGTMNREQRNREQRNGSKGMGKIFHQIVNSRMR